MPSERSASWSRAQRVVHWTIAALVLSGAAIGVYMVRLPFRELLQKFLLYQVHKTLGITVFLLALLQLGLHARRGRPPRDRGLPEWQLRAASAVHVTLFALLIVIPLVGYLVAATAPARVPTLFLGVIPVPHIVGTSEYRFGVLRRIHVVLASLLVLLAAGHALAAIHHHRAGRAILVRMLRG